jgi:CubicO group peptidase (beta-lactamase class C family)
MNRRGFIRDVTAGVLAGLSRLLPGLAPACERESPHDLGDLLEMIRRQHGLPGIAAVAVRRDQVAAEGVAGVRRIGQDDKITFDDRFPLASCTKSMTAAMVCRVIDLGKLSFDTTLQDALPDVKMRDDYRKVTVAQLLTFTGGIQPYLRISPETTPILFQLRGSAVEQRERFAKHLLQEEPVTKPGTAPKYSNASYALAGFLAEQQTGRPWEALMEKEVFKLLGMTTAGFDRSQGDNRPDNLSLHRKSPKGYNPADELPSIAALAPAGAVRCSIRDFGKFAAYELGSERGKDVLLKPATATRWHQLSHSGRETEDRPLFGGSPVSSTGYVVWPRKDLAVVVAVNGGEAHAAIKDVFEAVKAARKGF